jgi:hypothetical protein
MKSKDDTLIYNPTLSNLTKITFVLNDKHFRILPDDKIKKTYDIIYETESLFIKSNIPFTFIQKLFNIDEYGFITEDEIQIENISEEYIDSLNNTYKLYNLINKNQIFDAVSNNEITFLSSMPFDNNIQHLDTHNYSAYSSKNENLFIDDTIDDEPCLDDFFPNLDIKIEYKNDLPIFIKTEKPIKYYHYLYSFKNNKIFEINFEYNITLPEFEYIKLETPLDITYVNSKVNKENFKIIISEFLNIEIFKDTIKKYILNKYSFTNEEKDKKKISELHNEIISQNFSKIKDKTIFDTFVKNNLSNILKDFGLTKKRYSDGYYWYGLVIKNYNPLLIEKILLYKN